MKLLFLILTIFLGNGVQSNQKMSLKCTGPMKIKKPKLFVPDIEKVENKAIINVYPQKVKVHMAQRTRWTKYCYDGTFLDPNSGCTEKLEKKVPSKMEVIEWEKRGMCEIGHICDPYGECWGNGAQKCLDNSLGNWVKSSDITSLNGHWTKFPYHTCISQWSCNYHFSEFPIALECMDKTSLITSLPNGTSIDLLKIDSLLINNEDVVLYTDGLDVQPKVSRASTTCYAFQGKILCMIVETTESVRKGTVFPVDTKSLCGCSGNIKICIEGAIPDWGEKGKKIYFSQQTIPNSSDFEPFAATSLMTTKQLMNNLKITQAQFNYNLFKLTEVINKVQGILSDTIISVSKIDERLLGKLTNFIKTTHWINDELFRYCDLPYQNVHGLSNCNNDLIYRMGRGVKRSENEICYAINATHIKKLNLFDELKIDYSMSENPSLVAAHEDFEGWQWLSSIYPSIKNVVSRESKKDGMNGEMGNVFSQYNFFDLLMNWFVRFSAPVAWVSLIMCICKK